MKFEIGIIRTTKQIALIVLILSSLINTHLLRKKLTTKFSSEVFKSNLKVLEGEMKVSDVIQEFMLGLLSTVGIKGAYKISFTLSLILENKLNFTFEDEHKNIHECNSDGFFKYVAKKEKENLSESAKLKIQSCAEQKSKIMREVNELNYAVDCIALMTTGGQCVGETYKHYQKLVSNLNLKEKDYKSNFDQFLQLRLSVDKEYEEVKEVDCKKSPIDTILGEVVHKFKQGFYSVLFALSCTKDLEYELISLFPSLVDTLASFLTGEIHTFLKLLFIVSKIIISAAQLINNFNTKSLMYRHTGEIVGYLIRIPLELIKFQNLDSPIFPKKHK